MSADETKTPPDGEPEAPDVSSPEQQIGLEILASCVGGRTRMIARVVNAIYDEELRREGLGAGQFFLLALTAFEGRVRPADLQDTLSMNKSTVSRNVSVLVKRGWLRRVDDERGRGYSIELTAKGRSSLPAVHRAWRAAQSRAEEALGSDRFGSLKAIGDSLLKDAGVEI